ncbi:MAG: HIT family protein [Dehalococcoidia bacterium]|nr:HIT family protein [Dehalococcoidia bacterium]
MRQQLYRGYTIFLAKRCVPELHELPAPERSLFLDEMATVGEAVHRAFTPRKLNYELLGNGVPHLHWHLVPRYADDPKPQWPIWSNPAFLDAPPVTPIDAAALADLRTRARAALTAVRSRR